TMSERTSVAPVLPELSSEVAETPLLDRIPARDLGRLTLGLYFVFWGTLLTLVALSECMPASSFRLLAVLLLAAGTLALVTGAWRLPQVHELGDSWRQRTAERLNEATMLFYVTP